MTKLDELKQLIERLRMPTQEFHKLHNEAADALEQQAAVIEQMRSVMLEAKYAVETIDGTTVEAEAIHDKYMEALTLQPCPEVLNKVRADAVREAAESLSRIKGNEWISVVAICAFLLREAQHIEKGEA